MLHSVAICEGMGRLTLLCRNKEKLKEMTQIQAQHFVDLVIKLLQMPFGSRSITDHKLTVQQPRSMANLKIMTGDRSFQMELCSKKN